jgi:RNA polymerase sigma-70 factor (ECF subfamily)
MTTDICEIARRASIGDADAFDELYRKEEKRVFWYAWRMLGSTEDAEDVTQETFLDMYSNIGRLRRPEAIHVWALHIACNNCRRLLLGREPASGTSTDQEAAVEAVEESERDALPEVAAIDRERCERLRDAIASLGKTRLRAVALHYFFGMSCLQIGRRTGMTPQEVATNLYRARAKLRCILGEDFF